MHTSHIRNTSCDIPTTEVHSTVPYHTGLNDSVNIEVPDYK